MLRLSSTVCCRLRKIRGVTTVTMMNAVFVMCRTQADHFVWQIALHSLSGGRQRSDLRCSSLLEVEGHCIAGKIRSLITLLKQVSGGFR